MAEEQQQQAVDDRPQGFKQRVVDNRWLITVGLLTLAGVASWTIYKYFWPEHFPDDPELHVQSKIILVLAAVLIGWFFDIFTGKASIRKLHQMVAFCYVFPFAIVAGILIPLFAYPVALPDPPKPIGIILGCNERPIFPIDKDLVPDGIRCFNRSDQYLVNIGGNAERMTDEVRRQREEQAFEAAKAVSEAQGVVPRKDAKSAPAAKGEDKAPDKGKTEDKARAEEKAKAEDKKAEAGKPDDKKVEQKAPARTASNAANPAGSTDDVQPHMRRYIITGGLVVPLYFVIIAIFGGFVSMLRRVPEYQERVTLDASASGYLSMERAREKLVFEALQLLAAPLIAITAYYMIDPASRATSIALAFIAGFSSETVLMYIRALAEKIQPPTVRNAIDVDVKPTSLTFARQAVGTESPAQTVRLTNRSSTALTGTVTVPAEFGCQPAEFNVAAGSSVSFAVTFRPTSAGRKTGDLQIKDNAPGSPRLVHLAGEA